METRVNVRGVPLELHPSPDYLSDHIRRTGDFYEANILDYVARRLARWDPGVLVDVGAMIGNHTAYFAYLTLHTDVWAFEPHPDNFAVLRENCPWENLESVALSDWNGEGTLYNYDPVNTGHFALSRNVTLHRPLVQVRTLDSFNLQGVRLIKIDVEGGEAAVIRGAWRTISESRPLLLVEDWTGRMEIATYHRTESWPDQQTYLYEPS